jgi:hypothetical protein
MITLFAAAPTALALAALAMLGPPWISIEAPANPLDPTTRGALLLVHAFHHGTPMAFPVSGTAEGVVDGQRRTVKLEFAQTSRTGVYALRYEPPREGAWLLVIRVTQGPNDAATALVRIRDGAVTGVSVPAANGRPAQVSARDVEEALRAHAAT